RVERVEPPARGQPDRELLCEPVDRRVVLDRVEGRERTLDRVRPQPAVEELRAGMRLVWTRPLDAAELVEPRVLHPCVHRREAAALVPNLLGRRLSPIDSEPARDLAN